MYIRKAYTVRDLVWWTRHELFVFLAYTATAVIAYRLLEFDWLRLPWLPVALVGTAVAFLISFQNNASYGRLWEARKIWGGIVNSSRSWGLQVNDFLTNDFADKPLADAELASLRKDLVYRHLAWLTALRHAMRQPRTWEIYLKSKSNREWAEKIGVREHLQKIEDEIAPYISSEDGAYACGRTNKPLQLLSLQSKALRRLRTCGVIDDFRHMKMQDTLDQLLELQGRSERIKNFPYPRQYATINSVFVWIFIILLPFGAMYEFESIGRELASASPRIGQNFVWLTVPFGVLVMWVFHTMERIGRVSENPFEGSTNDVPITTMSRGIEIDLREMLDEPSASIPAPIAPSHHTQT